MDNATVKLRHECMQVQMRENMGQIQQILSNNARWKRNEIICLVQVVNFSSSFDAFSFIMFTFVNFPCIKNSKCNLSMKCCNLPGSIVTPKNLLNQLFAQKMPRPVIYLCRLLFRIYVSYGYM